jgi:hypothetical protein
MIRLPSLFLLLALLSGLLPAATATAQIPGLPKLSDAASAGARPAETRIAIADITARADEDERAIETILRDTAGDAGTQKFTADLRDITCSVERLNAKYPSRDLATLPVRRLESLERYWAFMDQELDAAGPGCETF